MTRELKYTALKEFLCATHKDQQEVTLTFSQIEMILGTQLPESAYTHPAWWSEKNNPSHSQAKAWIAAGFTIQKFSQNENDAWACFAREMKR